MPRFSLPALIACLLALLAGGPAVAGDAGPGEPTLLLSEVVVTPTNGEMIEIVNPTDRYIDLSNVYVTDATFAGDSIYYYNVVTGADAGGGGFGDFHARFPDGASIAPGERQCLAITGSDAFFGVYGELPTYELFEDGMADDDVPDMREALPGSINGQGGLANSGEVVILYRWDGASDLVQDLDYLVWGDKAEAVDKTGVSVDGPDGDTTASGYLADTAIASQDVVSGGSHAGGDSFTRGDLTEGAETATGGNGATGHDETSENLSVTWTSNTLASPDCEPLGAGALLLSEIVVEPTAGEFIEIFNPGNATLDLSDVYLTDATFADGSAYYYNIVTGVNAGGGGFGDFHARFPDGAVIDPGEYQTIALNGSINFVLTYGDPPTYELYEDAGSPDAVPDMREATAGSINGQGGLSNSGEVVILYHWNGVSDLVGDLDYAVWGDKVEAVDKTGVSIDGPDVDGLSTTYLDDTAIASQDVLGAGSHGGGNAYVRVDADEGAETMTGGNGVTEADETSEDLSNTWNVSTPNPGTGSLGGLSLTIADNEAAEGDFTTSTLTFTVTLSDPAPAGGVTFDITTVDGTATTADGDYVGQTLTSQTIAEGDTTYDFTVTINGDEDGEENETFTVEVTNVMPGFVDVVDGQAIGTILNDDTVEIFTIQGDGTASPFADSTVTTTGNVVTAVGPEGFFMQTPAARDDNDIDTSNGIYVFTATAPGVSVGDEVSVTGTVVEFFDFTEFTDTPIVTVTGTASVPPAIVFDDTLPSPDPNDPSCTTGDLECFEGMLVTITNGRVTQGNLTFGSDPIAEVAITADDERAFREPGVEFPGLGGMIPTWDGNPEVFELDPDKLGLPNQLISAGATFSATGGIGFEFGDFELWPTSLAVSPMPQPAPVDPVRMPTADELTVGTLNFFRLFDDVDDPGVDDTVVPTAEYDCRRSKFVAYIDEALRNPGILAVQEVDNLNVLQDLAADIQTAGGPTYSAHLVDGNDVGGIDVGYLVSSDFTVDAVTQLGATELLSCDGSLLHDRPPLLLEATYTASGLELAVLVLHQRSLGGIDNPGQICDADPSSQRVRQKRLEQAQSVAQMVQDFQTASPDTPLLVVGDFNAFEFTDGYVDVLGQIQGDVDPAENLLSAPTITDPTLDNEVFRVPTDERYSFIFDGSAQVLDHALSNDAAQPFVSGFDFGRGNADSPRILLDSCDPVMAPGELPLRASDHDGGVVYMLNDANLVIFTDGFESGDTSAWGFVNP